MMMIPYPTDKNEEEWRNDDGTMQGSEMKLSKGEVFALHRILQYLENNRLIEKKKADDIVGKLVG